MAKQKDITRNPPSWIEKGLFIFVIVAVLAIAFPIFWNLNKTTRELYACERIQSDLRECINEWREETGASIYQKIPRDELERRYGAPIPCCPFDSSCELINQQNQVRCIHHKFDYSINAKPEETPAS